MALLGCHVCPLIIENTTETASRVLAVQEEFLKKNEAMLSGNKKEMEVKQQTGKAQRPLHPPAPPALPRPSAWEKAVREPCI